MIFVPCTINCGAENNEKKSIKINTMSGRGSIRIRIFLVGAFCEITCPTIIVTSFCQTTHCMRSVNFFSRVFSRLSFQKAFFNLKVLIVWGFGTARLFQTIFQQLKSIFRRGIFRSEFYFHLIFRGTFNFFLSEVTFTKFFNFKTHFSSSVRGTSFISSKEFDTTGVYFPVKINVDGCSNRDFSRKKT